MRKTKVVVIDGDEDNRDRGKNYLITEMPASQGERWAIRVSLALIKSGAAVPEDLAETGMAGLASLNMGALTALKWDAETESLLTEMFRCIQIIPDPQKRPEFARTLIEEDIEEIRTRISLRWEVLALHMGFSLDAAQSKQTSETSQQGFSITPTSRDSSVPSSQ